MRARGGAWLVVLGSLLVWVVLLWLFASCTVRARVEYDLAPASAASAPMSTQPLRD
jgi:hypothetical protein